MKKTLAILAVLALTAPVFAGSVDLTIDGSGNVVLSNIVGDPPVGLALKVDAGAGAGSESVAGVSSYGSFFDVFIDYAHDNSGSYAIGDGHPVAKDGSAGVPASVVDNGGQVDLSEAIIVLSMGELDNANSSPDPVTLAQICLDAAGDVHLDVDSLRGGVVDTTGAQMAVNFIGGVGGQIYNVGPCGPACWSCPGQALGDATGDGNINLADLFALKAAFGKNTGDVGYNPCADFTRDGHINLADLFALKAGFGTTGLGVCP